MNEAVQDYYERYWSEDGWLPHVEERPFPSRLRSLIAREVGQQSRVLDAGCGDGGKYGTWLSSLVSEYHGVDIAENAVIAARARGLDATRADDISQLPFADGSFDVCVCVEVLEHLVFPLDCARELRRLLKPGGVLIATVPNTTYWRRRLDFVLLGRWNPGGNPDGPRRPWDEAHLRFFTRKTFERMLTEAGFETRVLGIGGSLFGDLPWVGRRFGSETISSPIRFLEAVMPSLFGATLAAVGRKA